MAEPITILLPSLSVTVQKGHAAHSANIFQYAHALKGYDIVKLHWDYLFQDCTS